MSNAINSTQIPFYSKNELQSLLDKGVILPAPDQVLISKDVKLENLHPGCVIHPFSRISGEKTVIHARAEVGVNGAATVHDSVVGSGSKIAILGPVSLQETTTGPNTILGSGAAESAVLLGKESMANDFSTGYGFRIRKGSLYEEDASSAQHTDTKMTLLAPWVTLGSNINFCDITVTGGTGPNPGEFSEIGSGTIHFNFTIRGDKATASILGNIPEGVFLKSQRVFIGGNNSLLGPLNCDFGVFTAAGIRAAGRLKKGLNMGRGLPTGHTDYNPQVFSHTNKIIGKQVEYIGQLCALYHWYIKVRSRLAANEEMRSLYQAGVRVIEMNIKERIKQIQRFVEALDHSIHLLSQAPVPVQGIIEEQKNLQKHWPRLEAHLNDYHNHCWGMPEELAHAIEQVAELDLPYTQKIQAMRENGVSMGTSWLQSIVHRCNVFFKDELKSDSPTVA